MLLAALLLLPVAAAQGPFTVRVRDVEYNAAENVVSFVVEVEAPGYELASVDAHPAVKVFRVWENNQSGPEVMRLTGFEIVLGCEPSNGSYLYFAEKYTFDYTGERGQPIFIDVYACNETYSVELKVVGDYAYYRRSAEKTIYGFGAVAAAAVVVALLSAGRAHLSRVLRRLRSRASGRPGRRRRAAPPPRRRHA